MKSGATITISVPTMQKSGAKYCVMIIIKFVEASSCCKSNIQVGGNYNLFQTKIVDEIDGFYKHAF